MHFSVKQLTEVFMLVRIDLIYLKHVVFVSNRRKPCR
jgi:hypothetical protein